MAITAQHRRHAYAVLLAAALLGVLLLLASLDGVYMPEAPQRTELRAVEMYAPPPPPPPPPPLSSSDSASLSGPPLSLANQAISLDLQIMDLDVSVPAGQFGDFGQGLGGDGAGMGIDWGAVNLSELDGHPYVENAPVLSWPDALKDSAIDEFSVMFHIFIDETGRVHPVRIVESPHPDLDQQLMDYASKVRFSPPTQLGIPVRTEYLWPVLFSRY